MNKLSKSLNKRALTVVTLATTTCTMAALPATSAADLQGQIAAGKAAVASLHQAIAADNAQIGKTTAGLQAAQARLSTVQAELTAREHQLKSVQESLLKARNHLVDLENRLSEASAALSRNLVALYENQPPNLMTVILSAHGFTNLLEQVTFARRISHQDATIVARTRAARLEVHHQAEMLATLEQRDTALTKQVLTERDQAAALQGALLQRQIDEINARGRTASKLGDVGAHLRSLQSQQAAIEARAVAEAAAQARATAQAAQGGAIGGNTNTVNVAGIALDAGGMVQAPAGAPQAVKEVIAAGNAIATMPYIYGGGHGSFQANGYDCSGSVSYALAAAGLVSSPLDSTSFESWGEPGPGRWITVYANADHAWMTVAGWRFDTVAQAYSGTRWAQGGGEFGGMVMRHPAGL